MISNDRGKAHGGLSVTACGFSSRFPSRGPPLFPWVERWPCGDLGWRSHPLSALLALVWDGGSAVAAARLFFAGQGAGAEVPPMDPWWVEKGYLTSKQCKELKNRFRRWYIGQLTPPRAGRALARTACPVLSMTSKLNHPSRGRLTPGFRADRGQLCRRTVAETLGGETKKQPIPCVFGEPVVVLHADEPPAQFDAGGASGARSGERVKHQVTGGRCR